MESNQKASEALGDIISKAATRQVGDTRVDKHGDTLVWTEYKPGKFDWRKQASSKASKKTSGGGSNMSKLLGVLKKKDVKTLKEYANKPGNAPELRQAAYDELVSRDEDVSDIDLKTGRYGKMIDAMGDGTTPPPAAATSAPSGQGIQDILDDEELLEEMEEWDNPDFIKKKFGGLKTKRQRIAADQFIHKMKTSMPHYVPPQQEIFDLNKTYSRFLRSDSPLMIASGGAGVGKSYNFHLVAEIRGKRPFDSTEHEPGDGDYDYAEVGEVASPSQLLQILQQHNGKVILFDDTDNVLTEKDCRGIMKKATASGGKRIIGKVSMNSSSNVDPFEFTGQIIFLTNMTQDDLTKDSHINAIYSRAIKKDINFTKREQLQFIGNLRHKFDFTGIDRLDDKTEDQEEREDVFEIISDNIDSIDPGRFTSRTMMEAINKKRAIEEANEDHDNNPSIAIQAFGPKEDWKDEVKRYLVKGTWTDQADVDSIQKALEILKFNE